MTMAKVTSKGQVTIPSEMRKALQIEAGDHLLFDQFSDKKAALRVIKSKPLAKFRGALPATKPWPGKQKVREEIAMYLATRHNRTGNK
jgi:AbrB family looped-hinge helix DNA binding protein